MVSSVSRQDEPSCMLWLATWAGKKELSCPLGTTHHVPWEKFPQKPNNKSFIDQAFLVKMAGYWSHSFFAISVHKHAKKKLANIQPSWSHAWSITHINNSWCGNISAYDKWRHLRVVVYIRWYKTNGGIVLSWVTGR